MTRSFVHRAAARLAVALAPVVAIPAWAQMRYDFTIQPTQSAITTDTSATASFEGTLIGDHDPQTNPKGTQTRPGLFGGSGNMPIPISGSGGFEGSSQTEPAGVLTLTLNTASNTLLVTGTVLDLLNEATPALDIGIELLYQTFRTFSPSSLYIGGIPIPLPLGQATLLTLYAEQTPGAAGLGTLTPTGPGRYDFTALIPLDFIFEAEFLGNPIASPGPVLLPLPLSGSIDLSGPTPRAAITLEFDYQETIPVELPALENIPIDLPTILPPGGVAHLLFTIGIDEIALDIHLDGALVAEGEAVCLPDFDGNGMLNVADYVAFQTAFALGDPRADVNADAQLNVLDYIAFQTAFALGCS